MTSHVPLASRLIHASLFLALVACASAPPRQAFNRDAHADFRTVLVLPMKESAFDIVIHSNPGRQFGLIGTAIAEADGSTKRRKLQMLAAESGFDLEEALGTE